MKILLLVAMLLQAQLPSDTMRNGHDRHPRRSNREIYLATADCRDGTHTFSAHRRGTCSHHGGVLRWRTPKTATGAH